MLQLSLHEFSSVRRGEMEERKLAAENQLEQRETSLRCRLYGGEFWHSQEAGREGRRGCSTGWGVGELAVTLPTWEAGIRNCQSSVRWCE